MKLFATLILLILSSVSFAQQNLLPQKTVTWKINNLKKIGGHKLEVLGNPQIIKTDKGKAILFNGIDDGIFIPSNPLADANEFTIEAIFRPDEGGEKEQRWLHIEDTENVESRALLETRLVGKEWFVDTFLKSGENRLAHYAENFKHPLNQWFHVAMVFDGKEMRHYVNGKLELAGAINIKPFGKGITSIGVRQNKVYWFKGAVRIARFTNQAISPDQFLK